MRHPFQYVCMITLVCYLAASVAGVNLDNTSNVNWILYESKYSNRSLYITEDLLRELNHEESTWHWYPWLTTRTRTLDDHVYKVDCVEERNSLDSFPTGIFTEEQLSQGWAALYALFGIYCFTLVTIVCGDYFLPCVELICEDLKIPPNVAAATFMSVATSCPEFFVNLISTFLTESDLGIGTILGSALFNALGVAAIGGLAAVHPLTIDRRAVTRDVVVYCFNVTVLMIIVWDGKIMWYEAIALFVMYIFYFIVMFNSLRIYRICDAIFSKCCQKNNSFDINEERTNEETEKGVYNWAYDGQVEPAETEFRFSTVYAGKDLDEKVPQEVPGVFEYPSSESVWHQVWWIFTLPLRLVLVITVPSPIKYRKLYPVTFFLCIVWIGVNSYCISWSITVIGHVLGISDSVMGMTFLALGGCLPEACSIFILSRRGEGAIGVSNAMGANSLAILFALGLPWLIKTLSILVAGTEIPAVFISSTAIELIVAILLIAVASLWTTLFFEKFQLRKRSGVIFLVLYACFLTVAILIELGVVVTLNTAVCLS